MRFLNVRLYEKWIRKLENRKRKDVLEEVRVEKYKIESFYWIACRFKNQFGTTTIKLIWLRGRDLNPRPPGYEPGELPSCSTPRH